jgi:hypothetical protein
VWSPRLALPSNTSLTHRYSPSETALYPSSTCVFTISLTALSSSAFRSAAEALPASKAQRVLSSSAGRRSEPRCSARKV